MVDIIVQLWLWKRWKTQSTGKSDRKELKISKGYNNCHLLIALPVTLAPCYVCTCLHLFAHLIFTATLGNRYYWAPIFSPFRSGKWSSKKVETTRREVNRLTTNSIIPLPPVHILCHFSCYVDEWSLLLAKATSSCVLDPTIFTYSRNLFCNSLPFSFCILNCSLSSGSLPSAYKYVIKFPSLKSLLLGASLVAQWLRICLPMQGSRVRALVWEDPTCRGATRPVSHNYWACASGACAPQQERPR